MILRILFLQTGQMALNKFCFTFFSFSEKIKWIQELAWPLFIASIQLHTGHFANFFKINFFYSFLTLAV